ncbi:DUF1801 domain-containing protein [Mycetocola zhadangensis]|uniref:DUF1801 domain-containing protein n=1 Tax=Mycetocola zhadangensis TaxID=1164595 RepID=A0A3L7J543_9MICO|nr:DUF1801 domain-containing protein [Mycetocola zhadangensis]RLQ85569.1 DUF1801 domain-containing protein [Mycetocola zhadangensis]GGE83782.1 hypothetical protein GCM10011313_02770 [Mycetocola zhadangensis]
MAELKTTQNDNDPQAVIEAIESATKRADAAHLLHLMSEATGDHPKLWGTSMIGFGSFHYRYASGHEGDSMRVGFAPRKTALTLYGLQGHPRSEDLLASLGKFTLGKGCVYVKRLEDVDTNVLRQLITHAYEEAETTLDSAT